MDITFPTQDEEEGFHAELTYHRDNIIILRNKALMQNNFEWAVALSHTIAFLSGMQRAPTELPPDDPNYSPFSMDANHDGVISALLGVRTAIINAPKDILTDTFWMPEMPEEYAMKGATVVDYIDHYLPESLRRAAEEAQET
jgi:hypothetical protein